MTDAPAQLLQAALALHRQGDIQGAAARYQALLQTDPRNADALYYLALIACQTGRFAEGADLARRSADAAPSARAYDLTGKALSAIGRKSEALAAFDAAIATDATFAAAHGNRAALLSEMGRHADALAGFDAALARDPQAAEDWSNRGSTLQALGRYDEALASYDRALALNPAMVETQVNRASVLKDLSRHGEALAAFDRALALRPDFAEAHAGRSVVLGLLNRNAESLSSAERAVALQPNHPLARFARGMALKLLGRMPEARRDFAEAARLAPQDGEIAFALGMLQLLQGEWETAWPNFERRRQWHPELAASSAPRWRGESFDGRLVLATEQGLGDAIQFARLIPVLMQRGFRVSVLTSAPLVPFMRGFDGVETVVTSLLEIEAANEPFRWAPLMSVAAILNVGANNIPGETPYWTPDPERVRAWTEKLPAGFRIGIAWQGNPDFTADKGRSVPLAMFAPLAAIENVQLIALQKNPGHEQVAGVSFRDKITTPIEPNDRSADSLLDTAALMKSLDLIVTSDTMLAHLAGALGVPAFVALRRVPDWRWLLEREDCPWYPTLRLFRQTIEGDWANVFTRIAQAARERAVRR